MVKFEDRLVKFMKNFLIACEMSVSLLKFMQSKESKKETLAKAVERLVNILLGKKGCEENLKSLCFLLIFEICFR